MDNKKFKIGDEVQSVNNPSQIGTVVEIGIFHAGAQYYRVNFGSGYRPIIDGNDLRIYQPNLKPIENLFAGNISGYFDFQRLITLQRLLRECPLQNNVYSFNASRT